MEIEKRVDRERRKRVYPLHDAQNRTPPDPGPGGGLPVVHVVLRASRTGTRLDALVLWSYGDYQFRPEWDVASSMEKARALGFTDAVDSYGMFIRQFEHYRAEQVIP